MSNHLKWFLLFIAVCNLLTGRSLYSQWYNIYTSPYNDQSFTNSIVINSNQNVYASGYLWTTPETNEDDYLLMKYSLNGDTVFTRTFNILGEDEAAALAVAGNDDIIVAGKSENPSIYDIVVLKYSSSGTLIWQRAYNGPSNRRDEPCCLVVDAASNIYVAGKSYTSATQFNTVIIKYNSSGSLQWVKTINLGSGGMTSPASMIIANATGNLYLTGNFTAGSNNEIFTTKLNSNGTQDWIKILSPPSVISSAGTSLALDNLENVLVCGKANINNSPSFITLKYNTAGDSIWSETYTISSSNSEDCAYSICIDSTGNSYITGKSFLGTSNVQFELVTISYNAAGSQRWISHYNNNMTSSNNIPVQITLNRNNKPVVCAYSTGSTGYFDFLCLRFSSSGQPEGEQRFHASSSQDNVPSAMCIDNSSDIYFTGYANYGFPKATTVKFANNLFGIRKISTEVPEQSFLYQNYPNPFNPSTTIRYEISKPGFVKLKIFDIAGREAAMLVNGEQSAGTYEVDWKALDYPSGIYFYFLETGSYRKSMKMILIK